MYNVRPRILINICLIALGVGAGATTTWWAHSKGEPAHASSGWPGAGPFELGSHDFGVLRDPAVLTHEFRLTNQSKETWVVRRKSTDCGCVTIASVTDVVPPSGVLAVKISLDARHSIGEQTKHVRILLDPGSISLVGEVTALILTRPYAAPDGVLVRKSKNRQGSGRLSIHVPSMRPDAVTLDVSEAPLGICAKETQRVSKGKERVFDVEVAVSSDFGTAGFNEAMDLVFRIEDSGETRKVVVPITVLCQERLFPCPAAVIVSTTSEAQSFRFRVVDGEWRAQRVTGIEIVGETGIVVWKQDDQLGVTCELPRVAAPPVDTILSVRTEDGSAVVLPLICTADTIQR